MSKKLLVVKFLEDALLENGGSIDHALTKLTETYGIIIKRYPEDDFNRVILTYSQFNSPQYDPIVQECRGLVLKPVELAKHVPSGGLRYYPTFIPLAYGMDRFYNYGETDEQFEFEDFLVFTKEDGSLIHLYHDDLHWCVGTKGTAFAEGPVNMNHQLTFKELAWMALSGLPLQTIKDKDQHWFDFFVQWKLFNGYAKFQNFTHIFELCSPMNIVINQHTETFMTHLGSRSKSSFDWLNIDAVLQGSIFQDEILHSRRVRTMTHHKFRSFEELLKANTENKTLEEGFVCYSPSSGKRIKCKTPNYVRASSLLQSVEDSGRVIVDSIISGEDSEILLYLPKYTDEFNKYRAALDAYKDAIMCEYKLLSHIKDQKDFGLALKDTEYKSFHPNLRRGNDLNDLLSKMPSKKRFNAISEFL